MVSARKLSTPYVFPFDRFFFRSPFCLSVHQRYRDGAPPMSNTPSTETASIQAAVAAPTSTGRGSISPVPPGLCEAYLLQQDESVTKSVLAWLAVSTPVEFDPQVDDPYIRWKDRKEMRLHFHFLFAPFFKKSIVESILWHEESVFNSLTLN